MSTILYGSESWFTKDLRSAESVYMRTAKELLGVRQTTCNEIVLVELGTGDIKSVVRDKQRIFLQKLQDRPDYIGSYAEQVITQAVQLHTPMGKIISELLQIPVSNSFVKNFEVSVKNTIRTCAKTRYQTYCEVNSELDTGLMYTKEVSVPEYTRKAVTRLRLSSHRLKIETGRWS